MSADEFWAIQAAIAACGGLLLLAVGAPLLRVLDLGRTLLNSSRAATS